MACESGATRSSNSNSRLCSMFNFNISSLPPRLPSSSRPLPLQHKKRRTTGYWLRQRIPNAGPPVISACVVGGKFPFRCSVFIFQFFFFYIARICVWPRWPPPPLPHRHRDSNRADYGSAAPIRHAPRFAPLLFSSPRDTTLTNHLFTAL